MPPGRPWQLYTLMVPCATRKTMAALYSHGSLWYQEDHGSFILSWFLVPPGRPWQLYTLMVPCATRKTMAALYSHGSLWYQDDHCCFTLPWFLGFHGDATHARHRTFHVQLYVHSIDVPAAGCVIVTSS